MSYSTRSASDWFRAATQGRVLPLGVVAAAGVMLQAGTALACQADTECGNGQICSNGACIAPGSGPACSRDVECGPEQTCKDHHCVQSMPVFPGESAPPAAQPAPPPAAPPTYNNPPTYGNAPPAQAPPPAYPTEPPPPPPPPYYYGRRYRPPPPPVPFTPHLSFDVLAGGGLLFAQTSDGVTPLSAVYGTFAGEAELQYHVTPAVALALRGGTVLGPIPDLNNQLYSQVYAGLGLMFPWWRWGFILGVTNATDLNNYQVSSNTVAGRETGFLLELPWEYSFARWLKMAVSLNLAFYPGMYTQTIQLELGF